MDETLTSRVLVVGGGPGGYAAALRAGQLGLDTVLVEEGRLGGTCLIRGCIPSKALIHAAGLFDEIGRAGEGGRFGIHVQEAELKFAETIAWKDGIVDRLSTGIAGLLKQAGVRVIAGRAVFDGARTCTVRTEASETRLKAEHVVLATGSVPLNLPDVPFGTVVLSSTEALCLPAVPGKIAVIGAGYIGLELGIAFARLGSSVTLVEAQDRILPLYDAALVQPVSKWLKKNGISVFTGAKAVGWNAGVLDIASGGRITPLAVDKVLVAVGRKPNVEGWGIDTMSLERQGFFVKVDERCATSTANVWAIGDLVGEPMLAHKASAQGVMVADIIAGRRRRFDPVAIPSICFTEPEIVSVGLSPDTVPAGIETLVAQVPFAANGRAWTLDAAENGGFVRVVARRDNRRILGVQAVGAHVSELSAHFAGLMEMGAVLEDALGIVHAHPTLGETFHESVLKALNLADLQGM